VRHSKFRMCSRIVFCVLLLASCFGTVAGWAQSQKSAAVNVFPFPEKLTYHIDWRMITAGTAVLQYSRSGHNGWQIDITLESAGVVNRLYRVFNKYKISTNDQFCLGNAVMDAQQGKKHEISRLNFDTLHHKVSLERDDLIANTHFKNEIEGATCTHEIAGAVASLGVMLPPPGKTVTLPITDGKKIAYAKITSEQKDPVVINGKTVPAIRYEAAIFDNVLYRRKGRAYLWLTDDGERTPVQIRLILGFPIGTVNLQLDKQEKL
jgi:hypothetical protein